MWNSRSPTYDNPAIVIAGLDPTTHRNRKRKRKRKRKNDGLHVDARIKSGHDAFD